MYTLVRGMMMRLRWPMGGTAERNLETKCQVAVALHQLEMIMKHGRRVHAHAKPR